MTLEIQPEKRQGREEGEGEAEEEEEKEKVRKQNVVFFAAVPFFFSSLDLTCLSTNTTRVCKRQILFIEPKQTIENLVKVCWRSIISISI